MPAVIGLFTRVEAKNAGNEARSKALKKDNLEIARRLGVQAAASMNPAAKSPNLIPVGSKEPAVYILGEAPDEDDDRQGRHFIGKAGRMFRDELPQNCKKIVRFNYCVQTRPPKGRSPSPFEVECFRQMVASDIAATRPAAIIAAGQVALSWFGIARQISVCRGRAFPVTVAGHPCWLFPIQDPAYIHKAKGGRGARREVPGDELFRVFRRDIRRAFAFAAGPAKPPVIPTGDLLGDIECLNGGDSDALVRWIDSIKEPAAVDLETPCLRPYAKRARILSVAIATQDRTCAIALEHAQSAWSPRQLRTIYDALLRWIKRPYPKIAHNLAFELEWFLWKFGTGVLNNPGWRDTLAEAYCLDERPGGMSLDFCCRFRLGVDLKVKSTGDGSINRKILEHADVRKLLLYNGGDSKWTLPLHHAQQKALKKEGLLAVAQSRVDRISAAVFAQFRGLPLDHAKVQEIGNRLRSEEAAVNGEITQVKVVRRFRRMSGTFNPASGKHLLTVFGEMLGCDEVQLKDNRGNVVGASTDAAALSKIKHPLAAMILKLRDVTKQLGTYVEPLDRTRAGSVVWPDGLLHCVFNTLLTRTGRWSAEEPNVQNFPKRKHAEIRAMIAAPPGYVLLAIDYGQIEARVIAMASEDEFLVKALWDNYDVHMFWAERIAKLFPDIMRKYPKGLKDLRSAVKNKMVFPAFFKAGQSSIARSLGLPDNVATRLFKEFWDTFRGVRKWQDRLIRTYSEHGYVETLTGQRRREPLNTNMICNSGIQGTASDIVTDAMLRLQKYALETDRSYYAPVLNVHDDLTFLIEERRLAKVLPRIVRQMVSCPFKFVNVPITVEASAGPNWFALKEVGTFASNTLKPSE